MPRADIEEWADNLLKGQWNLGKRRTFGCPAYYARKRMVAFVYEDGLCIKLAPKEVEQKIADDAEIYRHFAPMGNVMKNWLLVAYPEVSEYEIAIPLLERALAGAE